MANLRLLAFIALLYLQVLKAQGEYDFEDFEERAFENPSQDLLDTAEEEERALTEDAYNEETERAFEDALADAYQDEMARELEESEFATNQEEEARNYEAAEEMNLRELNAEEERQLSADFDLTRPKEESVRQMRKRPQGRPATPLRLGDLIIRPVITRRCVQQGNQSIRLHCAKYLACGSKRFRGAIRTCESGQLFDAVTKKCNTASLVNCSIV